MAIYRCWSGSGVTQFAQSTAYSSGNRIVPLYADAGTNFLIARRWVWECTTAGTSAAANPTWPASVTQDTTTVTSGGATFTARKPGYSSGTTVDWTFATTIAYYACCACTVANDTVYVHKTHQEELAADSYINQTSVAYSVICVDKDSSEAPDVMGTGGWIGSSTTAINVAIVPYIPGGVFCYGLTLRSGGSAAKTVGFGTPNTGSYCMTARNCLLWHNSSSTSTFVVGGVALNSGGRALLYDCTLRFGHASQRLATGTAAEFHNLTISAAGSAPTALVVPQSASRSGKFPIIANSDLSAMASGAYLASDAGYYSEMDAKFINCKLPTSFSPIQAYAAFVGSCSVTVLDSSSGDDHYQFMYANSCGTLSTVTGIYANDGAQYDGTNRCSWRIDTTAYCDATVPFVTPWIDLYHDGTAAITPYIEILRDGSTTAYTDAEVYVEIGYQGTSGYTLGTLVDDRCATLGTPANQAAGVGLSGWTGEAGSAWSGKLAPASTITPAEIGMLRARVVVAKASSTVYVCPTVRIA